MKVLVTGGCGFVGTLLTKALLEEGHDIHAYDIMWFGNYVEEHPRLTFTQGDIRDIDSVPMEGMDAVIHLANVANDPCSDLNSKLNWEVNVLATKLLVDKAIECGVRQFIYASSGSVYGYKEEEKTAKKQAREGQRPLLIQEFPRLEGVVGCVFGPEGTCCSDACCVFFLLCVCADPASSLSQQHWRKSTRPGERPQCRDAEGQGSNRNRKLLNKHTATK